MTKMPVRILFAQDYTDPDLYHGVLVDGDYDGEYFAQYRWRILPNGYVQKMTDTIDVDATGKRLSTANKTRARTYLHREVANPPKGMWVRFHNGNPLDCRSANLSWQTPSESAQRRKQRSQKDRTGTWKSRYRGVHKTGSSVNGQRYIGNKWIVSVRGKYIGSYPTEEMAAKAYDKVAFETWGKLAILNFPEDYREKHVERSMVCPNCQAEIYGNEAVDKFKSGEAVCWNCNQPLEEDIHE